MGRIIYVDFDSTLTTGEGKAWWNDSLDEEPRWEMIEFVNELYKKNHTIIIYTARRESVRDETQYYLDKWGVLHHSLKMKKPGYDLLIDDRAMRDDRVLDFEPQEFNEEVIYE